MLGHPDGYGWIVFCARFDKLPASSVNLGLLIERYSCFDFTRTVTGAMNPGLSSTVSVTCATVVGVCYTLSTAWRTNRTSLAARELSVLFELTFYSAIILVIAFSPCTRTPASASRTRCWPPVRGVTWAASSCARGSSNFTTSATAWKISSPPSSTPLESCVG